jgi:DNA replication protein DnaC
MAEHPTLNKLLQLRLTAMADAYMIQLQDPSTQRLSFEERFSLLVDREFTRRKNNRLKRLFQQACLDQSHAHLADINYSQHRHLDKAMILELATGAYLSNKHNIIILGATGAGKSYIACALGAEACKQFYRVRYTRLPELLQELAYARRDGNYQKIFDQYRKVSLLILDEWMIWSLSESEARDVLELIHVRHKRASTIFCSQFAPAGWHEKIGQVTLADAILDRIVHDSYFIEIHSGDNDPSMREVYGLTGKKH